MSTRIDTKALDDFANKLLRASNTKQKAVSEEALNKLSQLVLNRVIKQTPRDTSRLVRSWQVSTGIEKDGKSFKKTIYNPTEYAVYVEYGHRTRGPHNPNNPHKTKETSGWVPGFFMLTRAIEDVDKMKNSVLSQVLDNQLKGIFT